jgi:hypothetical protein
MIDLYKDDLNKVEGKVLYSALLSFMRLDAPPSDRPPEGWQLDFKREWSDYRALQAVAGFANTFGGILIIGIDPDPTDPSRPGKVVQTNVTHEVKLQIASNIASNISPIPPYEIAECSDPADPLKRIWIVQVRQGTHLHLLTKKDSRSPNPVYVRNESGNLPADAARLRGLITERIEALRSPSDEKQRVQALRAELFVLRSSAVPGQQKVRSDTSLRLSLVPKHRLSLWLDKSIESRLSEVVRTEFPKTATLDWHVNKIADATEIVARDSYELRIRHDDIDYERRWRIKSSGDFGFVSQTERPSPSGQRLWSLHDVVLEIACALKSAAAYWKKIDYSGEVVLVAEVAVIGLTLFQKTGYPHGYASIFYTNDSSISSQLISGEVAGAANAVTLAELESNTVELQTSLPEIIANVLNQIVRCLGYSTRIGTMEDEIKHLLSSLEAWKKRPDAFCVAPHPSPSFLSNAPETTAS